ncbi:MAG TPA: N-acetylmuramoyl-L-alanine amidase [bacterium]|nr:N-acetylmuramoyl-L-alanine amidase [bacterium]
MRHLLPSARGAVVCLLLSACLLYGTGRAFADPVNFGDANARMSVYWLNGMLVVGVYPQPNEGYIQIARRVMSDPDGYQGIVKLNRKQPVMTGRPVVFPIASLKPALWSMALHAMYPDDELTEKGWAHTVTDPLESLIQLTEAYTGSRRYFRQLAKLNHIRNPNVLRIGDEITVPLRWIPDDLHFRPVAVAKPLRLEKDKKTGELYALYTVAQDDTLYSLLLRFTDRERAEEINRMSRLLVKLNGLRSEERLLVGRTLRIPLEWLSEDYLVAGHMPVKRLQPPEPAPPKTALQPVQPGKAFGPMYVIIDPGHGGVDPGAVYGKRGAPDRVWEHEVAFDVATRLKALLKARGFKVFTTVVDPGNHYPRAKLSLAALGDEVVPVSPPYKMRSSRVSINMRVYLINALYRQLTQKQGVSPDHVVLVSIHGDALAPTLRGAMVYYPDHRLRVHEFAPNGHVYRIRAQAALRTILFHPAQNRSAEDSSRGFAEQVMGAFRADRLGVSHRKPVRPYYYRNGERTLPGVLRYSLVPTSVLVEVANLNNRADRLGVLRPDTRQRVAQALSDALGALRNQRSGTSVARKGS